MAIAITFGGGETAPIWSPMNQRERDEAQGGGGQSSAEASNSSSALAETKRGVLAAVACALAFYALFIARTSFTVSGTRYFVLFEDAMISMRYARNLAEGAGLTWNAGEPPIEGYTNLLWTLWMSGVAKLGLPESKISLAIMATGALILVANALVIRRIASKLGLRTWGVFFAVFATLGYYPLIFWTLRGMEVGALALALDAMILCAFEHEETGNIAPALGVAALASVSLLLRSDALIAVGAISFYTVLVAPRSRRLGVAAMLGLAISATAAGHTLFRYLYYHDIVPNTYYAKLHKVPLSARLKRGLFTTFTVLAFHLAIPLGVIAAALSLRAWRSAGASEGEATQPSPSLASRARDFVTAVARDPVGRKVVLLSGIVALQCAYATYVGGDAWEWMLYSNRYMTVAMPALAILTAVAAERVIASAHDGTSAHRAARAFGLTLVACGLFLVASNLVVRQFPERGVAATLVFSRSTFLAGIAFTIAGAALAFAKPLARLVGRAASRAHAAAPRRAALAAIGVMVAMWLPGQLQALGSWALRNAAQYRDEARYARLGLLLAEATSPDVRIAVAAAGATPYFSRLPTEDLLGKNDGHVAKLSPIGVFSPGHDKWDYRYSLGKKNPAIIVELLDVSDEDRRLVDELGFVKLENSLWVRAGAPGVDPELVSMPFDTDGDVEKALASRARRPLASP